MCSCIPSTIFTMYIFPLFHLGLAQRTVWTCRLVACTDKAEMAQLGPVGTTWTRKYCLNASFSQQCDIIAAPPSAVSWREQGASMAGAEWEWRPIWPALAGLEVLSVAGNTSHLFLRCKEQPYCQSPVSSSTQRFVNSSPITVRHLLTVRDVETEDVT